MAQVYVEVEENPNCGYSPLQTFQALEPARTAGMLRVPGSHGSSGPQEVVGWCSRDGGAPCAVTYVRVTDSGAGSSLLVSGGDYGIRLRPANDPSPWALGAAGQRGEPYLLLDPAADVEPLDGART